MALIIVGENIDNNEKEKEIDLIFNEIDEELSKLENKLIKDQIRMLEKIKRISEPNFKKKKIG